MSTIHPDDALLKQMDKDSLFHGCTSIADHLEKGPIIFDKGEGIHLTTTDGRKWIDGASGLWCVNIGHGNQHVINAIKAQAEKLCYTHSFTHMSNEASIRLADKVLKMLPDNMSKIFWGCNGSDANDTIIKLIWNYNYLLGRPEKKKIIARDRAYHGITVASSCLTAMPVYHNGFTLPMLGDIFLHTDSIEMYRNKPEEMSEEDFAQQLVDKAEQLILEQGPETVAAFFAEPTQGTGGVLPPPASYYQKLKAMLNKYDVLLVADEVIDGFGRLGETFGTVKYGIEPDFMTLAKGLSSGYTPISGVVVGSKAWDVLASESTKQLGGFGHGYTYAAHPIAAAGALANVEVLQNENLVQNAAEVGPYLREQILKGLANNPFVGDFRTIGMKMGLELVANPQTKQAFDPALKVGPQIMAQGYEENIICRALPHRDVIGISPPLIMTKAQADEYAHGLTTAINKVTDKIKSTTTAEAVA